MLIAARLLGAQRAELVRYATSADISGDRDQVVGYAGIIVE
jgi:AmmeMemoRadiSam system protein B